MAHEGQKSFLMYDEYEEHFELLTDEELGALMRAIFEYKRCGKVMSLSPGAQMAFSFIKKRLDEDAKKYEARCEQNQKNAAKGGRPKSDSIKNKTEKNKRFTEESKKTERFLEKPKKPDNDNDNDININIIPPVVPLKKADDDLNEFSEDMQKVIKEWFGYKKERREDYKPLGRKSLITEIKNNVSKYGGEAVAGIIRTSMASGYKGIVFDRLKAKAPPDKKNFEVYNSGRYDYDNIDMLARQKLQRRLEVKQDVS